MRGSLALVRMGLVCTVMTGACMPARRAAAYASFLLPVCHDGLERDPMAGPVPRDTTLSPEAVSNARHLACGRGTTANLAYP